jgi:phage-related tail fiber protein
MAFSSTIDTRHHVMGDMILVTGTWNAASAETGQITLPDMSVVFASGVMADLGGAQTAAGVDGAFVEHTGIGALVIACVSNMTGRWWALGKR